VDISVIVCTYNRANILQRALESLICQETDGKFCYEILVVDDASTDGTSRIVEQIQNRSSVPVRYVCEKGYGIAHARNRGVRECRGEWIAFTDDDQLAEPNWLKELFEVATKTGAYCVGGNRLLLLQVEPDIPIGRITRAILGEEIHSKKSQVYRNKFLPGTENLLIKRSVFDSIGGFDNLLLRGGEDYDLILRVRAAGFPIWSAPKAVVYHLIPPYRLSVEYLRWASLRMGSVRPYIDNKHWGKGKTLLACVARIGQALLINLPRLLLAYVLGDKADVLGRKCLLLRAEGYTRQTLFLIAPRLFPQKRFFAGLEFRKERISLGVSKKKRAF